MRKSNKGNGHYGRARIDIVSMSPDKIEIALTRSCDNPKILRVVDAMLLEAVRCEPNVIIKKVGSELPGSTPHARRGGPVGMPEAQKLEIVEGWFRVRGRVKQAYYARSKSVSTSTLRRWIRELRRAGKL